MKQLHEIKALIEGLRGNALRSAEPRFKVEWLQIARMWEELANEYYHLGAAARGHLVRDPASLGGA